MFCSECGAKNKEGSLFCESCGNKIEQNVPKKEKIKKGNKLKYLIGILVVLLVGAYLFLDNITNPKNIAKGFFDAVANANADKLYGYMDIKESEFTSKKMFKKVIKNDTKMDVVNYTVEKPVISKDKLSATVKVNYLLKGKNDTETVTIKLIKDKSKKYFLFDNWKINTNGFSEINNFEFRIPKNSKLQIEGIDVKDKYLKKDSDSEQDVYVIPSMFEATYNVKVTLPMDIELEDKVTVSSYSSYYTARLTESKLSDKMKEKIISASKKSLETIYNSVKDKKAWDDIKSQFEYKNGDLKDVESAYNNLLSQFNSSTTTLTNIKFTKIEISSLSTTKDGLLYISINASYDYTVTYQSGDETKTNTSNGKDYMYLTFDYSGKEFKLANATSLNSYFSKYY